MTDIDGFYMDSGVTAKGVAKFLFVASVIVNAGDCWSTWRVVHEFGTNRESAWVTRQGLNTIGMPLTFIVKMLVGGAIAYLACKIIVGEPVRIVDTIFRLNGPDSRREMSYIVLGAFLCTLLIAGGIVGNNVYVYSDLRAAKDTQVQGVIIDGTLYAPTAAAKQAYLPELTELERKTSETGR